MGVLVWIRTSKNKKPDYTIIKQTRGLSTLQVNRNISAPIHCLTSGISSEQSLNIQENRLNNSLALNENTCKNRSHHLAELRNIYTHSELKLIKREHRQWRTEKSQYSGPCGSRTAGSQKKRMQIPKDKYVPDNTWYCLPSPLLLESRHFSVLWLGLRVRVQVEKTAHNKKPYSGK